MSNEDHFLSRESISQLYHPESIPAWAATITTYHNQPDSSDGIHLLTTLVNFPVTRFLFFCFKSAKKVWQHQQHLLGLCVWGPGTASLTGLAVTHGAFQAAVRITSTQNSHTVLNQMHRSSFWFPSPDELTA